MLKLLDSLRLPRGCATAVREITASEGAAFPAEERLIRRAVAARRAEFRAGRAAARDALARLGCAPQAIPAYAERDPIWPRGFVGSITHCGPMAVAIAARAQSQHSVGIDLEQDSALEARLIASVCRPDEIRPSGEIDHRIDQAKLRLVAKEAVYKALFPLRRAMLGFHRVRVTFAPADGSFSAFRCDAPDDRSPGASPVRIAGTGCFRHRPPWLLCVFVMPGTARAYITAPASAYPYFKRPFSVV